MLTCVARRSQHADRRLGTRAATQETYNGMAFKVEDRKAIETPPEERETIYEPAWERGGLQFRAASHDMLFSKEANDTAASRWST
jgi:hypothetical protein